MGRQPETANETQNRIYMIRNLRLKQWVTNFRWLESIIDFD